MKKDESHSSLAALRGPEGERAPARVRALGGGDPRPPGSPPAMWTAFAAQSAWKSWTIGCLLAVVALLALALMRVSARPAEVILVDAAGNATPVRRSLATDGLLQFIADHSRPPELAVVRFTREFLRLALALNSSTVEASWPEALRRMAPELRQRVEAEAETRRLVETWRAAQRKVDLVYEEVVVEERTAGQLAVRATLSRRTGPLWGGGAATTADRVQVDLVERPVVPTLERPDGLEVVDWRLKPLPGAESAPTRGRVPEAR